MFDPLSSSRQSGQARMAAHTSLDTGLLVRREDELVTSKRLALPDPCVQVQNAPRLSGKIVIARKEPTAVLPGSDGVFVQPAPDRAVSNLGGDATASRLG